MPKTFQGHLPPLTPGACDQRHHDIMTDINPPHRHRPAAASLTPRRALTRIRPLGEVHQYQLDERSMPVFFVAAKSIRQGKASGTSGSADARDARAAALGALLEHRNDVAPSGL